MKNVDFDDKHVNDGEMTSDMRRLLWIIGITSGRVCVRVAGGAAQLIGRVVGVQLAHTLGDIHIDPATHGGQIFARIRPLARQDAVVVDLGEGQVALVQGRVDVPGPDRCRA